MEPSANPFESPQTDGFVPERTTPRYPLADPGKRFIGRFIDNLVAFLPTMAFIVFAPGATDEPSFAAIFYLSFIPTIILQAVLITTRGQSVGKMLVKTKIVDMQSAPAGFLRGVLLRSWLATVLDFIPLFSLIDALFVFRDDHRTIHDLIGGTQVVDVSLKWYEE